MCSHPTPCPNAWATDAAAARVIADHTEQGWSLLCNSAILFTDGGMLRPDAGRTTGRIEYATCCSFAVEGPSRCGRPTAPMQCFCPTGQAKGRGHYTVGPAGRH